MVLLKSFSDYIDALMVKSERGPAFALMYQFVEEYGIEDEQFKLDFLYYCETAYRLAGNFWVWNKRKRLLAMKSTFNREFTEPG